MSLKLILVFAVAEFLLSLTPGPAVFTVISQGMRRGFTSSLRGTAGILTGNAIYFALSALGLGALLMASATVFEIIRWAGVAYLILIGAWMLVSKTAENSANQNARQPRHSLKLFSQGLITQLSNPKAIVFFTALLPQFISPGEDVAAQFVVLGVVSMAVELPVLILYGWLAERGGRLIPKGRLSSLPDRIAGGFLIGAGVGLAALRTR